MLAFIYLEIVLTLMRDWCTVLRQTYHMLGKSFWTRSMVLLGDEAQVDPRFGLFRYSANLDAR
jgi:hypothetical protein